MAKLSEVLPALEAVVYRIAWLDEEEGSEGYYRTIQLTSEEYYAIREALSLLQNLKDLHE